MAANATEDLENESFQNRLRLLKSRIMNCRTKNLTGANPKYFPAYYPNTQDVIYGFRNLNLGRFCGVNTLYVLALYLLSQNKQKFRMSTDSNCFESRVECCIEEVNKVMISQAGKI